MLERPCPVCNALYAEHSLEDLAACMEDALGDLDIDERTQLVAVHSTGG